MSDAQNCKLCDALTEIGFNINLKLVPICDQCAASITMQSVIHVFGRSEPTIEGYPESLVNPDLVATIKDLDDKGLL